MSPFAITSPAPTACWSTCPSLHDREAVLLEIEKAGSREEPKLRQLARGPLRERWSDGEIDQRFDREGIDLADVCRWFEEAEDGGSTVKLMFGDTGSEAASSSSDVHSAEW